MSPHSSKQSGQRYRSALINTALVTVLEICGFSAAMRSKVSDGLQKVVDTIRAVMITEMVVAGYERTRQFPVDFAVTMRQSTYTFSLQQWATMTANLDMAANKFHLRGEHTETEMDELKISSVADSQRNKKPKDQRLLHQQRAVIMNSADCIAKYKNHHVRQEVETAQKLVTRQERDAARDATREAKQAERDRFANLSKEEKTAEKKTQDYSGWGSKIF